MTLDGAILIAFSVDNTSIAPSRQDKLLFVTLSCKDWLIRFECNNLTPLEPLPKLLNDIIVPSEGIAYAVYLAKPQRDAAAGAAVTYCVEILPASDNGVYQATLVALP